MTGRSGVETGRPVLDGVEAIGRQRVLDRKRRARERLRGKPLDRIAIDRVDFWIFEAHGVVVNPVNHRLPRRHSNGWQPLRRKGPPLKIAIWSLRGLIQRRYLA